MYEYVYVCMYICICIFVCMCMCVYMYMYEYFSNKYVDFNNHVCAYISLFLYLEMTAWLALSVRKFIKISRVYL